MRLGSRFRGSDSVARMTRNFQFQIKHLFRARHLGFIGHEGVIFENTVSIWTNGSITTTMNVAIRAWSVKDERLCKTLIDGKAIWKEKLVG
jgi:hypothetical protein